MIILTPKKDEGMRTLPYPPKVLEKFWLMTQFKIKRIINSIITLYSNSPTLATQLSRDPSTSPPHLYFKLLFTSWTNTGGCLLARLLSFWHVFLPSFLVAGRVVNQYQGNYNSHLSLPVIPPPLL